MARQYTTHTKFTRVNNAAAAATTDIETASVNMVGFESVVFQVAFGTITGSAVTSVKLQQSSDDGVADAFSDLEGTGLTVADTDDNDTFYLECVKPQKQYVRCVVDRGTQNAVVDGVWAFQYNVRHEPVTQGADAHVEATYSPVEGTA
jgi:hypothetical protein